MPSNSRPTSLGDLINAATASQHASLESIVMSNFRKCLYPSASTPLLYAKGLSYFLGIYSNLDLAIHGHVIAPPGRPVPMNYTYLLERRASESEEDASEKMFPLFDQCLMCAYALNEDVCRIEEAWKIMEPERLHPRTTPLLTSLTTDMSQRMLNKPHLMMSYAWIFYLAIFSGGRYMRASLQRSFDEAWLSRLDPEVEKRQAGYLVFWTFGRDEQESDEVRATFKRNFEGMAGKLDEDQREEVVKEAVEIMDRLIEIIEDLGQLFDSHRVAPAESGKSAAQVAVAEKHNTSKTPQLPSLVIDKSGRAASCFTRLRSSIASVLGMDKSA